MGRVQEDGGRDPEGPEPSGQIVAWGPPDHPLGIVAAKSGLTPARALLDFRQARFALRLMARPENGGGREEILRKRSAGHTARIREKSGLGSREMVEVQRWDSLRLSQDRVIVDRNEEALEVAQEWADQERTVWSDGSRLESGEVGAAVAWWKEGGWGGQGICLGKNKEVFDAEVFAILQAVKTLDARGGEAGLHGLLRLPGGHIPSPARRLQPSPGAGKGSGRFFL